MSSSEFTFDHDYPSKTWSHRRTNVPVQLVSLGVSSEDWSKFYDEASATAERTQIRKQLLQVQITKIKEEYIRTKLISPELEDETLKEIKKLQSELKTDWQNLSQLAEEMFPQTVVTCSFQEQDKELVDPDDTKKKVWKKTVLEYFGLKLLIINQNYTKYTGKQVLFYYDDRRQAWSLRRAPMPKELLDLGVTAKSWFEFYDYANGVRDRALLRETENEQHNTAIGELIAEARGNKYGNTKDAEGEDGLPLTRIKKLEHVKKENDKNTIKGWGVLQLKVKSSMGNCGVSVSPIVRGKQQECYGVSLHTDPNYKPSPNNMFIAAAQEQLLSSPSPSKEEEEEEEEEQVAEAAAPPAMAAAAAAPAAVAVN